jgi:hypothetical protein
MQLKKGIIWRYFMSPHPISNANFGLSKEQISDRMVQFTLTDLDSSYGIRVYSLAHFDGRMRLPWRFSR